MTGYKTYQGNQVDGAGPLGLVILTYDVLYKSLGRARYAVEQGDLSFEGVQTGLALEALIELSTSLDMDAGKDIAEDLARLYIYMNEKLVAHMCSGSVKGIDEVMALTETLRDAWKGLEDRQRMPAARPQSSMAARPAMAAYGY
ncbi:MAG: flagellar export chaperone FliS [Mariprofundaceae bacterium]|nr:flagellar export chaperone FliS [Mariprofundaceae bacterium]